MKSVDLIKRQQIDGALDEIDRLHVATRIKHVTAIAEARPVANLDAGRDPFHVCDFLGAFDLRRKELAKCLYAVEKARGFRGRDDHAGLAAIEGISLIAELGVGVEIGQSDVAGFGVFGDDLRIESGRSRQMCRQVFRDGSKCFIGDDDPRLCRQFERFVRAERHLLRLRHDRRRVGGAEMPVERRDAIIMTPMVREIVCIVGPNDTLPNEGCCKMKDIDDENDDDATADDWEDPEPWDQDDINEAEEIPCPYCGKPVSELAELCPNCRSYISGEDSPGTRKPIWKWLVVGLLIAMLSGLIYFLRG